LAASKEICIAILTDLGTDHRCFKLASSLKDMGYDPVIYCDLPRIPLGEAWNAFRVRPLTKTSHYHGFGKAFVPFLLGLVKPIWSSPGRTWLVLDCPPLLWVALLGRLRGKQVVYDSHEIFLETPLVLGRRSRRVFWRIWHDGGMALIRKMISVSPLCADYFRGRYPGKDIHLLPNAPMHTPAPTRPKPGMESGIVLIYQGGLRAASGLEETLRAMESRPRYRLEVFGFGPEEASLKKLARELGLDGRVAFHGTIPFGELRPHMEAAHIGLNLVQPICLNFALTLANKLFDYVHALTPVLLSDNPSHREFLARHPVGVAVDSFSPDAVRAGLEKIAADPEKYRAACAVAREEWTWNRFADGLGAFLES
jgi:glycosyltransferase involved in cell wall biosynthesis